MFIVLSESIDCFKRNARLVGIMQQNEFDMHVENFELVPLKCGAFNNTLSVAYLNYEDSGVIKNISSQFQYYSDRPLLVQFLKIEKSVFNFMTTLSIISYTVELESKLDVSGNFQTIQNTLVNTSDCWGPMTLNYSRSGNSSYLNLSAQPNDCLIKAPIVNFEFLLNGHWEPILINPNKSPAIGYNGFKVPFSHTNTLFYEQSYTEMNVENKQKLMIFFSEFQKNRLMQTRLSLQFKQEESSVQQQIYSYVSLFASESIKCQTEVNGFGSVSIEWLQVIGDLTKLKMCISGVDLVQSQAIFMDKMYEDSRKLTVMEDMASIMFNLGKQNASLLKLENVSQAVVFLTFLDENDEVVREEVKYYQPVLSCFQYIMPVVSAEQTCITFFPIISERCKLEYGSGVKTRFQQILQSNKSTTSRLVYQTFEFQLFYNETQFYKQCLNNNQYSTNTTFTWYEGNFIQRQTAFINQLKTSFQPLLMIDNSMDFQFKYSVGIDQISIIAMSIGIIFIIILVITLIVLAITAVKLMQ